MPPSWMRFTRTTSLLAATAGLPDCLDRPEPLYHLLPATPCQPAGSLLVVDPGHTRLAGQFHLLGLDHQFQALELLLLICLLLLLANSRDVVFRQTLEAGCLP